LQASRAPVPCGPAEATQCASKGRKYARQRNALTAFTRDKRGQMRMNGAGSAYDRCAMSLDVEVLRNGTAAPVAVQEELYSSAKICRRRGAAAKPRPPMSNRAFIRSRPFTARVADTGYQRAPPGCALICASECARLAQ